MWVLIIWMIGSSPSIATQEFNSESSCRAAFAEVKKVNDGGVYLRGACTPKD
ncbi:hypothetical protein RPW61_22715 [Citrobacter freundii]|jgi:hypothetical protein|uniref:hypothetical protein n=1 Tax=Citrobacter freundii TaxID=546 RepID=UPI002067BB39|nr:hypothetical protein [Citrobacter freundii]MDT9381204.1 hypothetical protein [Citrobacter freundii]DAU67789.1 MAG TPA: hypothetical protein [Caudoviricetes sp.]